MTRKRSGLMAALVAGCSLVLATTLHSAQPTQAQNPGNAGAQSPPVQPAPSSASNKSASSEVHEVVRYEREVLERQSDRQVASVLKVVDVTLWAIGILAVVVLGVGGFFVGRTMKEIRQTANSVVTKRLGQVLSESTAAITAATESYKDRIASMEQELAGLLSYRNSNVVWVVGDEGEAGGDVVQELRARGLENLNILVPINNVEFDIGFPDVVILSYDASQAATARLDSLLTVVGALQRRVPIIVYTFDNATGRSVRLNQADEPKLAAYRWFVPANFPVQLIAQVFALLRTRVGGIGP